MLRIVLPKGSLERATLDLFEAADLAVSRVVRCRLPRLDRRPTGRRGPHPAPAGDPALRRGGDVRPRGHRARLDRGDGCRGGVARRARVLEDERAARAHRRRDRRGLSHRAGRRPATGPAGRHRVPGPHASLLREEGHRRRHPPLVRRDRGEGPRDRRLHRRSDRDGPGAQGRGPEDHRLDPDVAHRADREPTRL